MNEREKQIAEHNAHELQFCPNDVHVNDISYLLGQVAEARKLLHCQKCGSPAYEGHFDLVCHGPSCADSIEQKLTRAQKRIIKYEEYEASVCPEDVGFVEYIGVLQKELAKARRQFELEQDNHKADNVLSKIAVEQVVERAETAEEQLAEARKCGFAVSVELEVLREQYVILRKGWNDGSLVTSDPNTRQFWNMQFKTTPFHSFKDRAETAEKQLREMEERERCWEHWRSILRAHTTYEAMHKLVVEGPPNSLPAPPEEPHVD